MLDRRHLHFLLTVWGCYWRELADRLGSTGPSPLAAFRDGPGARSPGPRLPACASLLSPRPPSVRLVDQALAVLVDQGQAEAVRVLTWEYITPRRTQRQTAREAGMDYECYLYRLRHGRQRLSLVLDEIPPERQRLASHGDMW